MTRSKLPRLPSDVAKAIQHFSPQANKSFHDIRALIFQVARETDGVGELTETLKWGEPSYLTMATKSGTTVRVCSPKSMPDKIGIYVNCKTTLMDTIKELYGDQLTTVGNRAIMISTDKALPIEPVRHIIALALTYHINKK